MKTTKPDPKRGAWKSAIAVAREAKGWNQSELARAVGVTPQAVQKWESGASTPRPSKVAEIAKALGIGPNALMTVLFDPDDSQGHVPSPADEATVAGRLRALMAEAGTDVEALGKAAKVPAETVAQWLSGELPITLDGATGIQDAYGYSAVWIVMGKGPMKAAIFEDPRPAIPPPRAPQPRKEQHEAVDPTPLTYLADVSKYRQIPVVGRAQGGLPDRIWTDGDYPVGATEQFAEIATADPHAFLTPVVGLSMVPRYNPGEFALVEPGTEPELEDDVLVRLNTGETMIKRLLSRRQGVRLGSYNDPEIFTFDPDAITWMYYIAHPVPARKIKTRL